MDNRVQMVRAFLMSGTKRLVLAIQFLTIIPTPQLKGVSLEDMKRSVIFFPLVGTLLGTVLWIMEAELGKVLPRLACSSISLAVYSLFTGALHWDGLMDTADALGSRKPKDQALEIMKDSRVGAMGVASGIMVYVGKLSILMTIPSDAFKVFVLAPTLSRFGMVLAMTLAPSARGPNGLGGIFAKQIRIRDVFVAATTPTLLIIIVHPTGSGILVFLGSVGMAVLATRLLSRRFEGMTGDTYGAVNEILEWFGWVLAFILWIHR